MADRLIKTETLTDIADAIRERTETTAAIDPRDFASHIRTLEGEKTEPYDEAVTVDDGATVVFDDDYTEGYKEGEVAGYNNGVEAGKKAEYDEFWENALLSTSAIARFAGNSWNDQTFNPPYPLCLDGNCNYLFYTNGCTTLLGKVEKIAPTNAMYMFQFSKIQHITVVDLSNLGAGTALLSSAFASDKIVTIALIISSATVQWRNDTFQNATALENVIFEGVIGQNGLNMQWSTKLSKASIKNIIEHLSATTSGLSITLSKTAVNNAFEDVNLFNPLHSDKTLSYGKLADGTGLVVSDYIDCADFAYIAINQGGSFGWYSDKSEDTLISYENKSICNVFRCYQKPEGARYVRVASPKDVEVVACGRNELVSNLDPSTSAEWTSLIGTRSNWTISLL